MTTLELKYAWDDIDYLQAKTRVNQKAIERLKKCCFKNKNKRAATTICVTCRIIFTDHKI